MAISESLNILHATLHLASALTLTTPPPAPQPAQRVSVLVYLLDLVEITGADQSFLADVFIAALWHDPALADAGSENRSLDPDEVWHPNLVVINERAAARTLPEVMNVDQYGNVQYSMRLTGRFSAPMNLAAFPLDRQTFSVWVVAPPLGGRPVALTPDTSLTDLRGAQLSVSDWTIAETHLVAKEYRATPSSEPLAGVALVVSATRNRGYYVIQVLIPLVAIVLMAWTVFWIDPAVVATRVGVVVSTMLTLIAYRFMLGNLVPKLSYLTRLDYFMLGATSMVTLTLFVMAGTSYLARAGRGTIVERIDRVGRVAFPLVFG
ncbi:MAG: hypothetical protein OEW06_17605, partial [Gemmatimonadota bacterium]|nr:hypothetical protein [Gemmatimonadota bacterium]